MTEMKMLVISACFLSVGISVVRALLPGKKFENQMRLIFAFMFVSAIAVPVISGDVSFEIPELSENASVGAFSYNFDENMISETERRVEEGLKNELEYRNLPVKKITVSINIRDENRISISNVGFVPQRKEDSDEITAAVKAVLGDEVDVKEEETDEKIPWSDYGKTQKR